MKLPPASLPTAAASPPGYIYLMKESGKDWTISGWPGKDRYLWDPSIHSLMLVTKSRGAKVSNLGSAKSSPWHNKDLRAGRLSGRWSQQGQRGMCTVLTRGGEEMAKREATNGQVPAADIGLQSPETPWKTTCRVLQNHPAPGWSGCAIYSLFSPHPTTGWRLRVLLVQQAPRVREKPETQEKL